MMSRVLPYLPELQCSVFAQVLIHRPHCEDRGAGLWRALEISQFSQLEEILLETQTNSSPTAANYPEVVVVVDCSTKCTALTMV